MTNQIIALLSQLIALIVLTTSSYLITSAIGLSGLRFDTVALGVILGSIFLTSITHKIQYFLMTKLL